ncbi:MAG: histidinol phosphatase [Defluviitaleaceae bacterium]|nr:histidinol phosphatase [Defluviitaleaceae bacterium]
MFLYETHLHCSPVSACGADKPEDLVRAYKARGYTGFILTDHFFNGNSGCPREWKWESKVAFFLSGYERAKKEGDKCGFDVFLGWEYAIHGSEFLTYGLDADFLLGNPHVDRYDITSYGTLVRENGGYIAQAHPYREAFWVANPFPVAPHLIDGVEVFNASQPPESNKKAFDFARLHNLPMQAGSDAHSVRLNFASGIKMKERAKDIHDIIAAIKKRKVELIC